MTNTETKKLVKENQEEKKSDYPTTDSSNTQSPYAPGLKMETWSFKI